MSKKVYKLFGLWNNCFRQHETVSGKGNELKSIELINLSLISVKDSIETLSNMIHNVQLHAEMNSARIERIEGSITAQELTVRIAELTGELR